jgi:DUF3014 family protein
MIPEWKPVEEPKLPTAIKVGVPVLLLVVAGGAYWYYAKQHAPPAPVANTVELPVPVPAPAPIDSKPKVRNPVPSTPDIVEKPLPPLNESDATLRGSVERLTDAKTAEEFLVPENLVRNFVVTVDNLTRVKVASDRRPVKPTPGATVVEIRGNETILSEENYARYAPFVSLVQAADAKQATAVYLHYYPLFQRAYEDLGYPDDYFNDRMVDVIDHLLATPTPAGPIKLTQPKVFFEYADPALEGLSAGQKLLLRMGPANAAQIKAKLKELRVEIASQKPRAE